MESVCLGTGWRLLLPDPGCFISVKECLRLPERRRMVMPSVSKRFRVAGSHLRARLVGRAPAESTAGQRRKPVPARTQQIATRLLHTEVQSPEGSRRQLRVLHRQNSLSTDSDCDGGSADPVQCRLQPDHARHGNEMDTNGRVRMQLPSAELVKTQSADAVHYDRHRNGAGTGECPGQTQR